MVKGGGRASRSAERIRKKKASFMSKERARARLARVFLVRNGLFRTGSYHNVPF